ncbi:non-ribosomal peptide synthetase [Limosilactobacillus reuteri]|uniref:non-ribosomal peptide synthetase n=1 Tax=Limosilactobacillus reuteri TaxID=1598 RepID=UPI001E50F563|nr:non-ribosomal peptide synthetase [Limosilactobacillus reuteri]MCC4487563.1 amino acid adenylation domain-containing protein [Limosilactobacillus reuteri]
MKITEILKDFEDNKIEITNYDKYIATPQQKALWFEQKMNINSSAYNISILLGIKGLINESIMANAINNLVKHERILRTSFKFDTDLDTVIQIPNEDCKSKLDIKYVFNREEMNQEILKLAKEPFNLEKLPLFKIYLFQIADTGKYYLLLVFHHIISDGTSMETVIQKLSKEYNNLLKEDSKIEVKMNPDYLDYSFWLEKGGKEKLEQEILEMGEMIKPHEHYLNLPLDHVRQTAMEDSYAARYNFKISENVVKKVQTFAQKNKVSMASIFLSIYYVVLSRVCNQKDVTVSIPFANRMETLDDSVIGYFVNTLAVPQIVDENTTFYEFIQKVSKKLNIALDNQQATINKVVEYVNPNRNAKFSPLSQVLFVYQNTSMNTARFGEAEIEAEESIANGFAKNDINLTITPELVGMKGFIEYKKSLFNTTTIERITKDFKALLNNVLDDSKALLMNTSMLTSQELKQQNQNAFSKLRKKNDNSSLITMFKNVVNKYPNKVALSFEQKEYTYKELDNYSNSFAKYLKEKGVKSKQRVALFISRSDKVIISILGILKLGATYVPIDSSYPSDRIKHILFDSGAKYIVTEQKLKNRVKTDRKTIFINEWDMQPDRTEDFQDIESSNDAYIIYTSGSTGLPKGVRVAHKNVLSLIRSTNKLFEFNEHDVWTLFHSYAFDFSVWEIWGALLHGAKLVVVPYLVTRSTDSFYRLLIQNKVTVLNQTPSAFEMLSSIDAVNKKKLYLRYIIFGGEKLNPMHLKSWFSRHDNEVSLINMYGITETTVHASFHKIEKAETTTSNSNIGTPLPELTFILKDKNGNNVRDGEIGEIYVYGEGVTNGYLNREELNKERFFTKVGTKGYKSGDLAYKRGDNFYYVGRNDFQVKIRGFRIELGEINSKLTSFPAINKAFTRIIEDSTFGKKIVSYYTTIDNQNIKDDSINKYLHQELPDYMIPNSLMKLDSFPLNMSGKVDRKRLPIPNYGGIEVSNVISPRNAVENELFKIWKKVLNRENFGVKDSFFDLGGHSLMAVRLMSLLQTKFHIEIPISTLFTNQTIESMAQVLTNKTNNISVESLVNLLPEEKLNNNSLFIIHPGMGQVMVFNQLAQELKTKFNKDVFAFQAPGLYGEMKPFTDMQKLAKFYANKLIEKNLDSYNLAGYCVGGTLAVEVAHILEQLGKKVASVQIIDIRPPHYQGELSEGYIADYFVEQLFRSFDVLDPQKKLNVKTMSKEQLNTLDFNKVIQYLREICIQLELVDKNYQTEQMENWYRTWKGIILGMNSFSVHEINAPIFLYHAKEGDYKGNEWEQYSRQVKTIDIPGDHYSILKDSNVKVLSKYIARKLEETNECRTN